MVRMWRLNAWPRLTVPPGRTRKRFFALLLVFIFGITTSAFSGSPFILRLQVAANTDCSWMPALASYKQWHRGHRIPRVTPRASHILAGSRILSKLLLLFRRQDHDHLPTFHFWKLLNLTVRLKISFKSLQNPHTNLLVSHFTTTKT